MSATDHERYQEDVGAYLLGALTDGESAAFERHLGTCHICQDELQRLSIAAAALPRAVDQFEPPASLKRALMEQVYAEAEPAKAGRRSLAERLGLGTAFRPALAAGLAAALLVLGVLAGYGVSLLGGDREPRSVVASVDSTRLGAARATLDGDQLRVTGMPQPPSGRVYQVWIERGGRIEPGPLFSVDRNGTGLAAVPGELDEGTRVMVTRERRTGARQPSEAPVVVAEV